MRPSPAQRTEPLPGVGPISRIKLDNGLALTYRGVDSFSDEINGFGGASWQPDDKTAPPDRYFVRYANSTNGELRLAADDLEFVTYGMENSFSQCFFAAGVPATSVPADGTVEYFGAVDGFAVIGGRQKRVFQVDSAKPILVFDFKTGRGTLEFELVTHDDPYGDFTASTPVSVGTVKADLQTAVLGKGFGITPLSGSGFAGQLAGGFIGRETPLLGAGGGGVAIVFELNGPGGDVIFGSIALAAKRN
jgi:hypothetical protein